MRRKFSTVREHCPPEKSFTNRQSLFAAVFGSAGASPSHFALVPRPTTLVPSEVGAQVLRDQQTEIRSMVWSWLHRQPQEFTA